MKRAFLVLGLEGSGTYMLWEALAAAGCSTLYGDDPYTLRYSFPHAGEWPNRADIYNNLWRKEYAIDLLDISRDFYCTFKSVDRRRPADVLLMEKALIVRADFIRNLRKFAHRLLYTPVSYEAFQNPGYRKWLFEERLGLPYPKDFEVRDENRKWYEEVADG